MRDAENASIDLGSGGSFGFTRSFGWSRSPSSSCSFGFSLCIRGSHGVDFSLQLALCFDFGPCGSINSDMCVSSNFGCCLMLDFQMAAALALAAALASGAALALT